MEVEARVEQKKVGVEMKGWNWNGKGWMADR